MVSEAKPSAVLEFAGGSNPFVEIARSSWPPSFFQYATRLIVMLVVLLAPACAQELACTSCHGLDAKRIDSPDCGSCHVGTSLHAKGQIRYSNVFDEIGTIRRPADDTFAVNAGKTYDTSVGHGGLKCESCHGDPHTQHTRVVWDCYHCHKVQLPKPEGPHGMHIAGQNWVGEHGMQVDENGASGCAGCHGSDGKGTVLSQAFADRNFKTKFGRKQFAKGAAIGCPSCHTISPIARP